MEANKASHSAEHHKLEKYLRLLLKNSPNNILFIDSEGCIDYCSDTFLKLSGINEMSRIKGMHFRDMYGLFEGEEFIEKARNRFLSVRNSKSAIQTNVTINFSGVGEPRQYSVQTTPMIDDNGEFEGAQVLYCDVTDLLTAEVAGRTRALLDSTPLACSLWGADGALLECNGEALRMFGLSQKSEYLENLYDLSPEYQPDGTRSREGMVAKDNEAVERGSLQFEWMHQTLSGQPLPVETTLVRIPWLDSYVFATYSRDLREIKTARDELRRMSSLVDATPSFVLYTDGEGNIEYANPAVQNTSGFSREELLKGGLALFADKEALRKTREEYLPRVMEEHTHISFEQEVTLKNGRKLILLVTMFTVVSQYGKLGVGLSSKDITELKHTQTELIKAKEKAEHYSRAKSDFLSRMSHEMRTPLNAIVGMTEIARMASDDSRRIISFDKVNEASKHLLCIINDIIDMSKIDTGEFALTPQSLSFSATMRSILDTITAQAAEKRLKFSAEIDGHIPDTLIADERRIKQMLINLLSNAVKFTPENGVVSLHADRLEDKEGKCTLRFEVCDNGVGISEEARSRLWIAFEQADNSIKRKYGGTGLGLPIAKRIAELMGGDITVESSPGAGSKFICAVRVESAAPEPPASAESGGEGLDAVLSGRKVLIVDDVEMNREILLALLEDTGAVFDTAQNGEEAVELFSKNAYNIVLMDLHMPVMDGFEATRRIRASDFPGSSAALIIAVTADTGADVYARCVDAGMDDHFGKPVERDALLSLIARHLAGQLQHK